MILVTIGSLFPFDRLIKVMDKVALARPQEEFFAQIGAGQYEPENMRFSRMMTAQAFGAAVKNSRVVVAHAGMGSVISAMEMGTPVVLLPRKLEWGEHTTDHQMATARWLEGRRGIYVAWEDAQLEQMIDEALSTDGQREPMSPEAPEFFLRNIRNFIFEV